MGIVRAFSGLQRHVQGLLLATVLGEWRLLLPFVLSGAIAGMFHYSHVYDFIVFGQLDSAQWGRLN